MIIVPTSKRPTPRPPHDDSLFGDAQEISAGIGAGRLSAEKVLRASFLRIEGTERQLKAWEYVDFSGALGAARQIDSERKAGHRLGPLAGVPVAVKDVIDVAGMPTGAGFAPFRDRMASADSEIIRKLRKAGAVVVGKVATAQFAAFDPPGTVNPWDASRTPGGSSTGSGVAVAAGHVPLALATQTGGSTLRPAAYNGVVGFKPSFGRISTRGVFPVAPSLDHVGVIARSVADCEVFAEVAMPGFKKACSFGPPRIGIVSGSALSVRDDVFAATNAGIAELQKAGAEIVPARLPFSLDELAERHGIIMAGELWAAHRERFAKSSEFYGPQLTERLRQAQNISKEALKIAQRKRQAAIGLFDQLWEDIDILLLPAVPEAAPPRRTTGSSRLLAPFSLIGAPSVAIPAGWLGEMPHSVQLVGARNHDAALLSHARWCAGVLGTPFSRPSASS